MPKFNLIGIDADDTLWYNERYYVEAQAHFTKILRPYASSETIQEFLLQTENRNVGDFGYGVKALALSMIESAVE